jgi:NNP family nitrate/nitrite transporter-like MFS transporter
MAPLMPSIEQDLNISHSAAGSLFLLISIGYLTSLMGSRFISSRLTHRKTIFISSVILGIALLAVAQMAWLGALFPRRLQYLDSW